jgi:NAD(P)-dependent dehydrogenase (short-subunit alcohol dehydrogenase family)
VKVAIVTGASHGIGAGLAVNLTASLVDHADSRSPSSLAALTKGGLDAVTRSLATEYGARGVTLDVDGGQAAGH